MKTKEGLYDEILTEYPPKKIMDWFKKPLKRVGKLYGVQFVTIKPFPKL